ncbi:MAG TPA: hypothetical protein PKM88_14375, partial [bacterium]|nr:hypothetical protein [bacterium]
SDEIKAYARFTSNSANLNLAARHIWLAYMPMTELNFRIGRFPIPFGHEGTVRPTEKVREIFISEYTQNVGGALNANYDIGAMAYGSLFDNALEYKLYTGNGVVRTVADSAGMVAASATTAQPDNNDAKQGILNLKFKPFTGVFVGGAYALGDFTNTNMINGVSVQRSRATAYDLNAGYEMNNVFRVSGEYATTRHDQMALEGDAGLLGNAPRTQLTANRVNEYILKATYLGVADWEFGVRYSVIDPKNFEAELAAGLSRESKISFALGYKFAGSAQLNAEYSRVNTDLNYLNNYDPALVAAAVNTYRINPCEDPFDDIYALQLGLQF